MSAYTTDALHKTVRQLPSSMQTINRDVLAHNNFRRCLATILRARQGPRLANSAILELLRIERCSKPEIRIGKLMFVLFQACAEQPYHGDFASLHDGDSAALNKSMALPMGICIACSTLLSLLPNSCISSSS